MSEEEFKGLSLEKRYEALKINGTYIASRKYRGFEVHLYGLDRFYVEVWQRLGLENIEWIEVVNSSATINSYADNIDLDDLN